MFTASVGLGMPDGQDENRLPDFKVCPTFFYRCALEKYLKLLTSSWYDRSERAMVIIHNCTAVLTKTKTNPVTYMMGFLILNHLIKINDFIAADRGKGWVGNEEILISLLITIWS